MAAEELFPGFAIRRIRANGTDIHCVVGGSGPPLLLLHGYPQTHAMWHRIAPVLAQEYTVVCPDLRGYGDSGKPASDATHAAYSKRAMAQDMVEVMRTLGFPRFRLAGHDRGGRVAHRLCVDHPEAVERVAVLDKPKMILVLDFLLHPNRKAPKIDFDVQEHVRRLRAGLERLLVLGVESGELKPMNPLSMAFTLFSFIEAATVHSALYDNISLESTLSDIRLLIDGLKA